MNRGSLHLRLLCLAVAIIAGLLYGLSGGLSPRAPAPTRAAPDEEYLRLRQKALTVRREEAALPAPTANAPAWGALMEIGVPEGTATLAALSDGSTSLYLDGGGGVIGGHSHEKVRKANAKFIRIANDLAGQFKPATSCPLAAVDHTVFYLRTDAGILTAGAPDKDLEGGSHPLSPLFEAGHEVMGDLHEISEGQQPGTEMK